MRSPRIHAGYVKAFLYIGCLTAAKRSYHSLAGKQKICSDLIMDNFSVTLFDKDAPQTVTNFVPIDIPIEQLRLRILRCVGEHRRKARMTGVNRDIGNSFRERIVAGSMRPDSGRGA